MQGLGGSATLDITRHPLRRLLEDKEIKAKAGVGRNSLPWKRSHPSVLDLYTGLWALKYINEQEADFDRASSCQRAMPVVLCATHWTSPSVRYQLFLE